MVYKSELDLYMSMKPVFKVKERLSKITSYKFDENAIWNYLKINKWQHTKDLQLYQIVNDIITIELNKVQGERI